eukprot:m51a1_g7127 putative C-tail anchored protein, Lectin domain (385) ;mRNA; f:183436-185483
MRALVALAALVAAAVARETAHSLHKTVPQDWVLTGDAAIHDGFVRLAPDRQSKKGALWNLNPVLYDNWEVTFDVRIHGVSLLGADGLAFWYVREPGVPGELYGSKELFNGFSLIVDTYDNDKTGIHPYVFGMWNDGTYKFDHGAHDHKDHMSPRHDGAMTIGELNGCTVRLRNLKAPTAFKVSYVDRQLRVLYSLQPGSAWTQCFAVDRITLPTGYYFGWSAATGDLADDHDVSNITVVDPRDSPASYVAPAVPGQPAAPVDSQAIKRDLDISVRTLQAKMDGLLDVVQDTLKATRSSPAGADVASLTAAVRTVQSQVGALGAIQATVAEVANEVRGLGAAVARGGAAGGGWGWLTTLLVLGLGGACAYLAVLLHKERRSKKLF